jgi:chromosome segregation ATPase
MIQSLWETEVTVETRSENEQHEAPGATGSLTVSVDDFSALEDRIRRAVDMLKNVRHALAAAEDRASQSEARAVGAEARAAQAEEQLNAQKPVVEEMQSELTGLRTERDQVRQRVERLLAQLDALEL